MIDFSNRLSRMKARRHGSLLALETKDFSEVYESEIYESLRENDAVKYVYGAMQAVNEEYTRITIDEGNRIADTLISLLSTAGIETTKKIQGSVALDIHIKGDSDIDMLIVKADIVTYETPAIRSYFDSSDKRPMVDIVAELRNKSEEKLTSRYHGTNVNCSNAKSISLSGGSLQRKVDIVPSCWHDTRDYQRTGEECDRGIQIYDKRNHELLGNSPFKHIHRVNQKDDRYNGNLKKLIRLLKNLVADMPDNKKSKVKKLSSYDLASIVYHMNELLNVELDYPLKLVANLNLYLKRLKEESDFRSSLIVPDNTRKIFDNDTKLEALDIISKEVDDLAISVAKAINPHTLNLNESLSNKRIEVYF